MVLKDLDQYCCSHLHQVATLSALREENEELREQNSSLSLVISKMAEKAGRTTRV